MYVSCAFDKSEIVRKKILIYLSWSAIVKCYLNYIVLKRDDIPSVGLETLIKVNKTS